ncbi:MAG TPA: hypothetical protein VMH39_04065 [Gemmatimonadaceae bacterium]|nr:hypothetical protein [Gemmatimonadaceae bacterium]
MVDDLRSDDGLGGYPSKKRRPGLSEPTRPLTDREVPLGQLETETRVLAPAVHAWLDGDLPEASVRRGDTARDVEFWKRVTDDADRRRHLRTPAHVELRIMEALPRTAPQVITPWWRREFVVTPTAALMTLVATMIVSAALTALLIRVG